MKRDFTYAVARVRAKELDLLSANDLDTLLACKNAEECLSFLSDKGWATDQSNSFEELLESENEKTWQLMKELAGENCPELDIFFVPNDFHNLKASIKAVITNVKPQNIFYSVGKTDPNKIYESIKDKKYDLLPSYLQHCAKQAVTQLLQTGDGQLCDIIIDRYSLETLYSISQQANNETVRFYAEKTIAAANIKMAVRCAKTEKSLDFIKQCLAHCDSINKESLAVAATKGTDEIYNYLSFTEYSQGIKDLKHSLSSFERWCDNLLISSIKDQKWDPFSVSPLIGYALARKFEQNAVRLIITAKANNLADSIIRERLRDMYV